MPHDAAARSEAERSAGSTGFAEEAFGEGALGAEPSPDGVIACSDAPPLGRAPVSSSCIDSEGLATGSAVLCAGREWTTRPSASACFSAF